jgi:GNAT superfamily N-acetyltransferase
MRIMTSNEILLSAMKQSAIDLGCEAEDFTKKEPVVVLSKKHENARRYLTLPFFFELASYGSNIVASVSPEIAEFTREYISRPDFEHCFESPALYELNAELAKYSMRIFHMAEYFLPDLEALNNASKQNVCPFPVRILTQPDFAGLYKPEWPNALCEKRKELDVLGVAAYDNGKMIGFAACSADCDGMWQIGIDVLPDYRRLGIAKSLVTRLACEILDRGKIPFYCAAWSNLKSVRCAIASGFRPAWVEITAKPI